MLTLHQNLKGYGVLVNISTIHTARALISSFSGTFLRPPYRKVFLMFCRQMLAAPLYVRAGSDDMVSRYLYRYGRRLSEQSQ